MTAYYNEFDKNAAEWLRQLIKDGLIAYGEVDDRSILDVCAEDLKGFTQHHFFAGIGGWSYALRLAGWCDSRKVCTASLPCQPFSVAGLEKGKEDERHLLPYFIELVRECRFDTIFGEQVESAIRHNWLDDLQTTMEAEDYTVGHCILGAHSVNAPHQRQRLYWVANSKFKRPQRWIPIRSDLECEIVNGYSGCDCTIDRMGNSKHNGHSSCKKSRNNAKTIQFSKEGKNSPIEFEGTSPTRIVSEWSEPEWLYCRDEKYRPIKSSIKPLVDGISSRMGCDSNSGTTEPYDVENTQEARTMRLKGYGNAIVPQVAAEFIKAFMFVKSKSN